MQGTTLANFSAWASLVSLALTLVNTILILRIKSGIVVNLTLEPLFDRLRQRSGEMNQFLAYYEVNGARFFEVAGICEADIRALRRRLGYVRSRFLRSHVHAARKFRRDRSAANAQEVYASLQQVRQHIANMLEERRITG
ncbi:MAG TPA: hypothetical protein VND87_02265 [Stellaceae bacterium]|nr:hypothetical protein [Stellaceae bacterium]